MNKLCVIFISILLFSLEVSAQKIYVSGGMSLADPRLNIKASDGLDVQSDVFRQSQLAPSLSIGADLYERDIFGLGAQLSYAGIVGGRDPFLERNKPLYSFYSQQFKHSVLSVSPLLYCFPIHKKRFKLGFVLAPSLDYAFGFNTFTNDTFYRIIPKFTNDLNAISFNLDFGIRARVQLKSALGLQLDIAHHIPMQSIVDVSEYQIYFNPSTGQRDRIEYSNIRYDYRYTRIQFGVYYDLGAKKKATTSIPN